MHYIIVVLSFIFVSITQINYGSTKKAIAKNNKKQQIHKKTIVSEKITDTAVPYPVSDIHIRVLLHEQSSIPFDTFFIESSEGFILENPLNNGKKGVWRDTRINLTVKNNILYVCCKDGKYRRVRNNNLVVIPMKETIHLNKKSYHGKLTIRIDLSQQKLLIINKLNIDDYIYSVLRNEMLSYWPLEIQKVQAIASRTYALHHMRHVRTRNPHSFYDIKNTNIHQVYGGSHDCNHLRKAVYETYHLILTYKNNIALTMFDICCGGIIPANMAIKDDDKPYLFRKNQCLFCKNSSSYRWNATCNMSELSEALCKYSSKPGECLKMGRLRDVAIEQRDRAGIVKKIALVGSKKKVVVTMQDFKRCLSSASLSVPKSYALDITKVKNSIKFSGKGYGHNIGLCQVGARELVKRRWDYKQILSFYYPDTSLVRLKVN